MALPLPLSLPTAAAAVAEREREWERDHPERETLWLTEVGSSRAQGPLRPRRHWWTCLRGGALVCIDAGMSPIGG